MSSVSAFHLQLVKEEEQFLLKETLPNNLRTSGPTKISLFETIIESVPTVAIPPLVATNPSTLKRGIHKAKSTVVSLSHTIGGPSIGFESHVEDRCRMKI